MPREQQNHPMSIDGDVAPTVAEPPRPTTSHLVHAAETLPPPADEVTPVQVTEPVPEMQYETRFHTVHTDAISHPRSTIEAMLANQTRPNRFRVHARVKAIIAQSGDHLARKWCRKCQRRYVCISHRT